MDRITPIQKSNFQIASEVYEQIVLEKHMADWIFGYKFLLSQLKMTRKTHLLWLDNIDEETELQIICGSICRHQCKSERFHSGYGA